MPCRLALAALLSAVSDTRVRRPLIGNAYSGTYRDCISPSAGSNRRNAMKNPAVKTSATLISLVLGASLLSACGRNDDRTVGQKADTAIAQTERGAQRAGAEVREAGRSVGQAAGNAADAVSNTTRDVGITASINAKLAADERLSALKINVDTSNGRVVLRGTAPDTEARSRATELARSVEGVTDVNNELSVQAR